MTVPRIAGVQLSEPSSGPLLILGPSLGTSVAALWTDCAAHLTGEFHVVGWDLPGHGRNTTVGEPFTIAELAAGVLVLADGVLEERGEAGGGFCYAGDSVGGAVGLQLLLDAPDRVRQAALICTGAQIGDAAMWTERAARVRTSGTPVMVTGSAERWFAPGFLNRHPAEGAALLHSLQDADREGYAQVCDALATYDVRDRLTEITLPVLAIAGAYDQATPPAKLEEIAAAIPGSRLEVFDDVAHLAPAERPEEVARLLREHFLGVPRPDGYTEAAPPTTQGVYDAGMPYAGRCWATLTSTGPRTRPPTSLGSSRSSSPRTPGARCGLDPAWTDAVAP